MIKNIFAVVLICVSLFSCKKNRVNTEVEEPLGFAQIITPINELDLHLTLDCGAENYKWTNEFGDTIVKILSGHEAIVGRLPSKEDHHFLITGKVGDIIYPYLLVFDREGNKVDSLNLYIGFCAGDDRLIKTTKSVISSDYSITMFDTIWYGNFATKTRIYDSICVTNKKLVLQDNFRYKVQDQNLSVIRNKVVHQPVDTILEQYHVQYFIKENSDVLFTLLETPSIKYSMDHSVYLTLKKKDKFILNSYEINKDKFKAIIPKDEIDEFQLWNMWIKDYSDTQIRFDCNVCIPDTDICYPIIISISEDGKMSYEEALTDYTEEE